MFESEKNDIVKGYVLEDGEVVSSEFFEKGLIQNFGNRIGGLGSGFQAKTSVQGKQSKADKNASNTIDLDIDEFGDAYSSGRVYRPVLIPRNLTNFSLENPYHSACIRQIAKDCCSGWDIIPIDKFGVAIPEISRKRSKHDNILFDFFNNCCQMEDFLELSKNSLIDYLTYGWNSIEVTCGRSTLPKGLYHMPSETVRVARDLSNVIDTDQKYIVQVIKVHARVFRLVSKDKYFTMIEPSTGNIMSEALYMRNYNVEGGKYGIPDWFPALKAMLGYDKVAEYNISFFNNEAVPRFAVVVTGGKLDDATKKSIKDYFKKDLKGEGNAHKTLVLTGPKGTDIKLVPLANDNKDGSFRFYKKDNRDEIITSHGVPHHRVQIMDAASSGSLSPGTIFELNKNYKYSTVKPLQDRLANMFNNLIKYRFGITDRVLQYKDLDIGEAEQRANTMKTIAAAHEKYYAVGGMTPNEVRQDIKMPLFVKGSVEDDIYEWATTPRPVYLIRQAKEQMNQDPSSSPNGLDANPGGQNINETTNDHQDKSSQQTQGNTQFNDKQMNDLLMKKQATQKVLKMLDDELNKSIETSNLIESIEGGKE